ncbi:MAG: hypothetical protein ETSY1_46545 (plasmid) [Candidatus Entotheonella factor]|uniref:Uncharacterized protein n=1 Tax=Entotheonella factor TaxID=1429438 RepID=W4LZZ6_ENTF1|nr:MAG: hypothetical protein ETSY1_46545 [Candidatus Entotheonella factor]
MHLNRFRKADRLTGKTFDSRAQCQVFALNLLNISLSWLMLISIQMTCRSTPIVGVIASDSKRLQQRFELQKNLILTTTKNISQ